MLSVQLKEREIDFYGGVLPSLSQRGLFLLSTDVLTSFILVFGMVRHDLARHASRATTTNTACRIANPSPYSAWGCSEPSMVAIGMELRSFSLIMPAPRINSKKLFSLHTYLNAMTLALVLTLAKIQNNLDQGLFLINVGIVLFFLREQDRPTPHAPPCHSHRLPFDHRRLVKSHQQTIFDPQAHTHTPAF